MHGIALRGTRKSERPGKDRDDMICLAWIQDFEDHKHHRTHIALEHKHQDVSLNSCYLGFMKRSDKASLRLGLNHTGLEAAYRQGKLPE